MDTDALRRLHYSGAIACGVFAALAVHILLTVLGLGLDQVLRGGAAGDLFCRVVIETPVGLTSEQKELLKQFDASLAKGSHHPRERSFFEGVKKFFTDGVD